MTQLSKLNKHWDINMSVRAWRTCPKYDIIVSGCTHNLECKNNGNKPCLSDVDTNTLPIKNNAYSFNPLTSIHNHSKERVAKYKAARMLLGV
jgi:hypothetical protein